MPSQDDRVSRQSGQVPIPGFPPQESFSGPPERRDGSTRPSLPAVATKRKLETSTDQLQAFEPEPGQFASPNFTKVLTSTLPRVSETVTTTSQRIPVVIKGSGTKRTRRKITPTPAVHPVRRLLVTLVGVIMIALVVGLALYTVTPLGHDKGLGWNPLAQTGSSIFTSHSNGQLQLIAQATATAVYHKQTDGYSGGGAQVVGNGVGSLNWPVGQCTYWANYRYHALTGFWVPWSGNADQWVTGARAAGWNVSTSPHVPSIIVLMAYVQLASGYGHVAVVENIVAGATPVTVNTSNMNWYNNGGGWDKESFENFTVGSGVYFVWHK